MSATRADATASIVVPLEPRAAFDSFVEDLAEGLARRTMSFRTGPNGQVTQGERTIGRVVAWDPGAGIRIEWRSAIWKDEAPALVDIRFESVPGGTRVSLSYHG